MKYYYQYRDTNETIVSVPTTKRMYDSYVLYNNELEAQLDAGKFDNFEFSDKAMKHHFNLPKSVEESCETYYIVAI
jgi:hypothetical protein